MLGDFKEEVEEDFLAEGDFEGEVVEGRAAAMALKLKRAVEGELTGLDVPLELSGGLDEELMMNSKKNTEEAKL